MFQFKKPIKKLELFSGPIVFQEAQEEVFKGCWVVGFKL
jgi:hypothetical protein